MNSITNYKSVYINKIENVKKKEQSGLAKLIARIKRPMGEKLGKQFSKVRNVSSEQKAENDKIKNKLIQEGKGTELKHDLNGFILNATGSKKWIIVFNGMGDCYESHLSALHGLSQDVGANVLAFNYREKPSSLKDWVEDGQCMLEYLKQKGVKPEDIVLYGHSLGGGIATDVYKSQKIKPGLILESTPSTLAKAIKSKRGNLAGAAAKLFNWNSNSFQVIKNADPKSLEHIALIVNRRDPTVRYQEASLYKKLGKKVQRVKIGEKHEEFGKVSVKGVKDLNKTSVNAEEAKKYREAYAKLRKQRAHVHLPHPHERVMDRRMKSVEGDENLKPFIEKFKREDEKAYEEIVNLFRGFLT